MNKLLMQSKREFWECRASFIRTPMIMGAILMGLLLLGIVPLQNKIGAAIEQAQVHGDAAQMAPELLFELQKGGEATSTTPEYLVHGLASVYTLFVLVLLLVLAFYLVDSLYSDRRDQSILFWKSMPVSEPQNVLTKLATGILGAPAFYAAAAVATGAFFLLVFVVYAGLFWNLPVPSVAAIATAFFTSTIGLVLGWLLLALWLLPLFGWLLFSSAIAKKAPFLVALGIPLGLMILEGWVLGSVSLLSIVKGQLGAAFLSFQALLHSPTELFAQLVVLLSAPAFWLGIILSALLVAGAIWLRINRWEI